MVSATLAEDGTTIRRSLRRAGRRRRIEAWLLLAPLVVFLLLVFVAPIGGMLWRAIDDRDVGPVMPRTVAALAGWQGDGLPGEPAFAALAADLAQARADKSLPAAARRLNYDRNGYRTVITNTARKLPDQPQGSWRETLTALDPAWGQTEIWGAIARAAGPTTDFYLLAALDLRRDAAGTILQSPPDEAIYRDVFLRTFLVALSVTALCLVIGFPVAYLLATRPPRIANILMILVLLPFWTSLLVRTTAWVVLLQTNGVVNEILTGLGLTGEPLQLVYNRVGVLIAMTHVLLPYMILPLYSVMRSIPPAHLRAAYSLGARPVGAFLRVYLPQTLPGIGAGALLVFILALGYYITPALVGGPADQMISWFIAFYTTSTVNWGMASALGLLLLVATLALYSVYARLVGADRMRLG
ncbi:ABC transporter permease [Inquilinus sp. YAF38]|uniref:ABC transporter permease n=1 Tax=Inquilinus sp. YAF38 TaxID=3233084 RepID=UPI003F8FF01D